MPRARPALADAENAFYATIITAKAIEYLSWACLKRVLPTSDSERRDG
jgi:hypothetical protein